MEAEVSNDGFSQYFYNSSGNHSYEAVWAFTGIGALKTAEICQKALAAFGRALPADKEERLEILDELESDELNEILEACDNMFYLYEDDLKALNHSYIMKHKDMFI